MKSAKEWAAEVVSECDGALVLQHLGGGRSVMVDVDVDASELDDVIDDARIVIERLVERVQADARAGTLRVWEILGGRFRLSESGHIQRWSEPDQRWYGTGYHPDVETGEDARRVEEWQLAAAAYRAKPPASSAGEPHTT